MLDQLFFGAPLPKGCVFTIECSKRGLLPLLHAVNAVCTPVQGTDKSEKVCEGAEANAKASGIHGERTCLVFLEKPFCKA